MLLYNYQPTFAILGLIAGTGLLMFDTEVDTSFKLELPVRNAKIVTLGVSKSIIYSKMAEAQAVSKYRKICCAARRSCHLEIISQNTYQ